FKGDNSFHPSEWFIRITPAFNLTKVTGNSSKGDAAIQEGFIDYQLAVVSPFYDTVDLRVGRQVFNFDFLGFVFFDNNDAVRLFGNSQANRTQWNLFAFNTVKHDPVSTFDTFDERNQFIGGANIIRQDFLVDGFNAEAGILYDYDRLKEAVNAVYLELAVDG